MKNQLLEKSTKAALLLCSLLFVASSCDEDDAFNPLLASIKVPAGIIEADVKLYLVASNSEGEIIEYAQIKNGVTTELKSDAYKETTFTLSIVSGDIDVNYKNLYGSSYHEVKRGLKIIVPEPSSDNFDFIEFSTQNFDVANAGGYSIASNGDDSNVYSDNDGGFLYLAKSPTRFFITKYNLEYEPVGFQFPTTTYTATQTPIVNLAGSYAAFQSETVNFAEPTYAGVDVYGRMAADNFLEQYEVSESYNFGTSLAIKFPGTSFPAYASSSFIEGSDYYYEAYHKSKRSDFSLLEVEANLEINGQTINYSVTTDGHVVSFDFDQQGTENEYFDWEVYAPVGANKSVTMPKLPAEITAGFSSYSYGGWTSSEELEVIQIEGLDSIEEYVLAEFEQTMEGTSNAKYVYLWLGTGIARDARMKLVEEKKPTGLVSGYKTRFQKDRSK